MTQKFYLVISFLFTAASSFAQTNDTTLFENKVNNEWQNSSRNIISYTADCRISYVLSQNWDMNSNTWQLTAQSFYMYDNEGRLQQVTQQYWDAFSNEWINSYKQLFNYADNNRNQSSIAQQWDALNNIWTNSYRITNHYNADGYNTANEFDLYSNNSWLKNSRTEVELDGLNRTQKLDVEYWEGKWEQLYKIYYEYRGNKSKDSTFDINEGTDQWLRTSRDFNEYLPNTTNLKRSLNQQYNGINWVNINRQESNFNDDGLTTTGVTQLWDESTSSWQKYTRSEFTYYDNDVVHQFTIEVWDATAQQWNSGYRATSTNNGCILKTQLVSEDELNHTTITSKDISTEKIYALQNPDKLMHQFSIKNNLNKNAKPYLMNLVFSTNPHASTIKKDDSKSITITNNDLILYPNPAHGYFTVSLSDKYKQNALLKITDATGKIVLQQEVKTVNQNINISSLPKALYVVTVTGNNITQQQKLVIY